MLATLSRAQLGSWVAVGRTLYFLEQNGLQDAEGTPWFNRLLRRLESLGQPVSPGHIYKVRRSFVFLFKNCGELGYTLDQCERAKISSVELAERLFKVDQKAGLSALGACLRQPKPATAAEIREQYFQTRSQAPDGKNKRNTAWESRKANKVELESKEFCLLDDLERRLAEMQRAMNERESKIEDLEGRLSKVETDAKSSGDDVNG
ncbi:hypothetical protein SAMN05421764_12029 [Donghicola eburneus]|nr:hypothetical protein SAMN05421764_12029 [Donghicola eburneus]